MPRKVPRCKGCGRIVDFVIYDGTGRHLVLDPISVNRIDDPLARRYVIYTDPKTGSWRVRLVTPEEPFDEETEHRVRLHVLTCARPPQSRAKAAHTARVTA